MGSASWRPRQRSGSCSPGAALGGSQRPGLAPPPSQPLPGSPQLLPSSVGTQGSHQAAASVPRCFRWRSGCVTVTVGWPPRLGDCGPLWALGESLLLCRCDLVLRGPCLSLPLPALPSLVSGKAGSPFFPFRGSHLSPSTQPPGTQGSRPGDSTEDLRNGCLVNHATAEATWNVALSHLFKAPVPRRDGSSASGLESPCSSFAQNHVLLGLAPGARTALLVTTRRCPGLAVLSQAPPCRWTVAAACRPAPSSFSDGRSQPLPRGQPGSIQLRRPPQPLSAAWVPGEPVPSGHCILWV